MKYQCDNCSAVFKSDKPLEQVTCPGCKTKFSYASGRNAVLIVPTQQEVSEFKQSLYHSLLFLASERHEFHPRKRDSLETLKESFFFWADEYNDGYFTEMEEKDRYCAWLVQEFRIWRGDE